MVQGSVEGEGFVVKCACCQKSLVVKFTSVHVGRGKSVRGTAGEVYVLFPAVGNE